MHVKKWSMTWPRQARKVASMVFPADMYRCENTKLIRGGWLVGMDGKETKPVEHKGTQLWRGIRITDAESASPKLRPPELRTHYKIPCFIGNNEIRTWHRLKRRRRLYSFTHSIDMISGRPWVMMRDRQALPAAGQEVTKSQTWFCDWTTTTFQLIKWIFQGRGGGLYNIRRIGGTIHFLWYKIHQRVTCTWNMFQKSICEWCSWAQETEKGKPVS